MNPEHLTRNDVLLIVDLQNDFCPGGSLPVPEGDRVVPVINRWNGAAKRHEAKVITSRDWHPPDHVSFKAERGLRWAPIGWTSGCDPRRGIVPGAFFRMPPRLAYWRDIGRVYLEW